MKNSGYEHSEEDSSARDEDLRRGPWTVEEDFALINYIARHGEGRWNSLSRCAGLKRTGKSCRLRWLNYLRPDVRRGNITLEEQLLILELHSRWGNRWSKIAQHLPGRTDNEIKNYWRTRVQKHAKQLKCDVNSKQFKDTMRYLWMPRLIERIQASSSAAVDVVNDGAPVMGSPSSTTTTSHLSDHTNVVGQAHVFGGFEREGWKISSAAVSDFYNNNQFPANQENGYYHAANQLPYVVEQQQQAMNGGSGYGYVNQGPELMDPTGGQWINGGGVADDWSLSDDINTWLFQPQDQTNTNPLFSFS